MIPLEIKHSTKTIFKRPYQNTLNCYISVHSQWELDCLPHIIYIVIHLTHRKSGTPFLHRWLTPYNKKCSQQILLCWQWLRSTGSGREGYSQREGDKKKARVWDQGSDGFKCFHQPHMILSLWWSDEKGIMRWVCRKTDLDCHVDQFDCPKHVLKGNFS